MLFRTHACNYKRGLRHLVHSLLSRGFCTLVLSYNCIANNCSQEELANGCDNGHVEVEPCQSAGQVRLAGGSNEMEGRVEYCNGSVWGTVCHEEWDSNDAKVVCRQLGYPNSGAVAHDFAHFGEGSGPIHFERVQCSGTEQHLDNCTHSIDHNCGHCEDAAVTCQEGTFTIY